MGVKPAGKPGAAGCGGQGPPSRDGGSGVGGMSLRRGGDAGG